ncbi:MAG: hypothetical protein H6832_16580 [Planctomycetes bacterium]|nr:hypothetical protein [Planctomycetota bacterium]MCB9920020.1 hypothetical protein [Planctomycetota bacterium]
MKASSLRAVTLLAVAPVVVHAQSYELEWSGFDGSTSISTGGLYELHGSIGDPCAGEMSADEFRIDGGFLAVTLPYRSLGTISSFDATAGPARIRLSWSSMVDDSGLTSFVVSRRPLGAVKPSYVQIHEVPYAGPGSYEVLDATALSSEPYQYLVAERYRGGAAIPRATAHATAYGGILPPNTARVGPGGFADITAAIAAGATKRDWVILVQPGTYAPFTIDDKSPTKLRILADGLGLVRIDTSSGAVEIVGRTVGRVVELRGLDIGSSSSSSPAMRIASSRGLVLVDACTIHGAQSNPGLVLDDATSVALQGCVLTGTPGLLASMGSEASIGRGSVDGLELTGSSRVASCAVDSTSHEVEVGSSLTELPGLMPHVDGAAFNSWASPLEMRLESFARGPLVLMISGDQEWRTGSSFEMPVLLSQSALLVIVPAIADAQGHSAMSFVLPKSTALLGIPFPSQFAALDPATTTVRMSNTRTFVILQ